MICANRPEFSRARFLVEMLFLIVSMVMLPWFGIPTEAGVVLRAAGMCELLTLTPVLFSFPLSSFLLSPTEFFQLVVCRNQVMVSLI